MHLYRSSVGLLIAVAAASSTAAQTPVPPPPDRTESRVESLLRAMTLEEKIDYIGGIDGFFVRDVPRLGIPRLKMADGPMGVRNFGHATAVPGGIGLAATWNTALAERVGVELGRDSRARGVHFLLAPGVNIYRAPMNGRNFEYFGEDPLLAARMATAYIKGVQSQGVAATVKHFVGNNSEYNRHRTDSIIDERALREIYLPAFEAAVKDARVGAIMTAYNLTNGVQMSRHAGLNIDVARNDWGFRGVVMTDWTSTYETIGVANGGIDLEMPSGRFLNREALLPAIREGQVTVATIDAKVRHILRLAAEYGWLDGDQADLAIPRFNPQGRAVAREAAREAAVLLKNDGAALPLDRGTVRTIAVIGPNAFPAVPVGGGSARVEPFVAVSLLQGLAQAAGPGTAVLYHRGLPTFTDLMEETEIRTAATGGEAGFVVELFDTLDFAAAPASTRPVRHGGRTDGFQSPPAVASRWTGYVTPKEAGEHELFLLGVTETSGYRVHVDGALVVDAWEHTPALLSAHRVTLEAKPHKIVIEQQQRRHQRGFRFRLGLARAGRLVAAEAKALAARADVVVVAAGFDAETEGEGADRTFALPPGQDELIRTVAAANKKTIVVLTSGGGVDMSGWIDSVPAVLQTWYGGEEGGTAAAEILFGDVNPSGRLPATFERRLEDNPAFASYYPEPGTLRVPYREGVFVGYRGYEKNGTKPLFAFGHGLSYTKFRYANLTVTPRGGADASFDVAFDLTNVGARPGAEVAQVYVGPKAPRVPRPKKELKGFAKVSLAPGETRRVTVPLEARAFAYYDVAARSFRVDAGDFEILVGRASDATELTGATRLAKGLTLPR